MAAKRAKANAGVLGGGALHANRLMAVALDNGLQRGLGPSIHFQMFAPGGPVLPLAAGERR